MTGTSSFKMFVLACISALMVGMVALFNTGSQGVLWEWKKADAAQQEAHASHGMVEATRFDSTNNLKGTEETALATITAAQVEAAATRAAAQQTAMAMMVAAQKQADALVAATKESVLAENEGFHQMTEPLITGPAKRMTDLNEEIIRLKRELENGLNAKTGLYLTLVDIDQKTREKRVREEELATLKETTQKNWSDSVGMMMGLFNEGLGGVGNLYPTSATTEPTATPPPIPRRFAPPEQ